MTKKEINYIIITYEINEYKKTQRILSVVQIVNQNEAKKTLKNLEKRKKQSNLDSQFKIKYRLQEAYVTI